MGECPPHQWTDRGTPGDYWRECWLCGTQEDVPETGSFRGLQNDRITRTAE